VTRTSQSPIPLSTQGNPESTSFNCNPFIVQALSSYRRLSYFNGPSGENLPSILISCLVNLRRNR
jgi:hypothetical protein